MPLTGRKTIEYTIYYPTCVYIVYTHIAYIPRKIVGPKDHISIRYINMSGKGHFQTTVRPFNNIM